MIRPPRKRAGYIVERAADNDLAASIGHRRSCDALIPYQPSPRANVRSTILLCEGIANREIATRLFISSKTVKVHVRHVYDKVGIRSRTALALQAASRRSHAAPTKSSPMKDQRFVCR